MSTMILKLPVNYVDIDREEMEYVDGGWTVCSVDTAGSWIDGAIIAASWAMGLGSAVSVLRSGGKALVKKVGARMARSIVQKGVRKALWFLSAGTAYAVADFVLTVSGSSIGKIAAQCIDSFDRNRYNGYIDV